MRITRQFVGAQNWCEIESDSSRAWKQTPDYRHENHMPDADACVELPAITEKINWVKPESSSLVTLHT